MGAGFGSVGSSTTRCARSTAGRRPSCAPARAGAVTPPRRAASSCGCPSASRSTASRWSRSSRQRAVPGVEEVAGGTYRRTLRLHRGSAVAALTPDGGALRCELRLDDLRDLTAAVARCRRLFDLDADPVAVSSHLGADPLLGPLVRRAPRAAGARRRRRLRDRGAGDRGTAGIGARARARCSGGWRRSTATPLPDGDGAHPPLSRPRTRWPRPIPTSLPMPRGRARALIEVARLAASGELVLDAGTDPDEAREQLVGDSRGSDAWTAGYVAMRALGDPDVFLPRTSASGTRSRASVARPTTRRGVPGAPTP